MRRYVHEHHYLGHSGLTTTKHTVLGRTEGDILGTPVAVTVSSSLKREIKNKPWLFDVNQPAEKQLVNY